MKTSAAITFDFTIGHYNGSMGMRILANEQEIDYNESFEKDSYSFSTSVSWPSIITIEVFGKNQNCDTQVDDQGNILADKFIRLDKLVVDRMDVPLNKNKIMLDTGTEKTPVVYWGFNGRIIIELDGPDSFLWHLKQRSVDHIDEIYIKDRPEVQDLKYTDQHKVDVKYHPARRRVIKLQEIK
jgi:hypothetical protein